MQFVRICFGVAALLLPASLQAAIIFDGLVTFGGTGLGAVNTVLTQKSPANTSSSTGCIAWDGTMDVRGCGLFPDNQQVGQNQTHMIGAAGLNLSNFTDLFIAYNASEPDNVVQMETFVLTLYSSAGGTLATAAFSGPLLLNDVGSGTGNTAFAFRLDSTSAAAFNSAIVGIDQMLFPSRLGLAASISNAEGGNSTFFFQDASNATAVPEPAVMLLTGSALCALYWIRRRKGPAA